MVKVTTIEEAEKFFLTHSSGSCIAVNPYGTEKEVETYVEACNWILGQ